MSVRTGDVTDDYCKRCRRITDHTVAALVPDGEGERIVSTTCRTCGDPHDYRHAKIPQRRGVRKGSAFDQVLAGILGNEGDDTDATKPKPR